MIFLLLCTASILTGQLSNHYCTYCASPCWKYSAQNSPLTQNLPLGEVSAQVLLLYTKLSHSSNASPPLLVIHQALLSTGIHWWAQGLCTIGKVHSVPWERKSRAFLTLSEKIYEPSTPKTQTITKAHRSQCFPIFPCILGKTTSLCLSN